MANKIQLRRDTSSNWSSGNPTLSQGELGHETNTGKLKVGDGSTAWNSLGYVDTTYSVGDGGLTQNNFTNADHSKLDGIAASANNYSHPNHSGEVTSTGDGATVIADNVVDEANLKVSNSPTNGYVLTAQSGNTGGLTWAAASGGGGADLYAANESSPNAQPSATGTNAIAIGDRAVATREDSLAVGTDTDATGDVSTALGAGAQATGDYSLAVGLNATSSGARAIGIGNNGVIAGSTYSTAIGCNSGNGGSVTATGSGATALGGSRASGTDSLAAAIATNSSSYGATGTQSISIAAYSQATAQNAVTIGYAGVASASGSAAVGFRNTASGNNASAYGCFGKASGANSLALSTEPSGGYSEASATGSVAVGQNTLSSINGKYAYASGRFAANGDAQGGQFILRADTTDATATALTTNNSTAAATNQIVAASDTCIMFSGTLVAMQNGAQDQGGWEIKGLLKNDGGTTTLVSSNIQTFDDGNGWVVALTADNTNNSLAITCTGEASHNIRWVANIQTSEVTYA